MSALIPGLLRSVAPSPPNDVLLACPGIVYRRDLIDRLQVGEPHQIDLWRIRRGSLGERELAEMIDRVANALLPGAEYRTHPAIHPYSHDPRPTGAVGITHFIYARAQGVVSKRRDY